MTDEKMKSAFQKSLPGMPEGFEAKLDLQLARLVRETKISAGRRVWPALIAATLLVLGAASAFAATNEAANAWLYERWPEMAQALMPVNLTSERQGIRLEVISAAAEDQRMLITFSLQDLEGNRIGQDTLATMDVSYHGSAGWKDSSAVWWYDAEQNKLFVSQYYAFHTDPALWNDGVAVSVQSLQNRVRSAIDLLPLLKASRAEAPVMPMPQDARTVDGQLPDAAVILKDSGGMSIPVGNGAHVFLTGIGMVNGAIHVQWRVTGNSRVHKKWSTTEYSYMPVDAGIGFPEGSALSGARQELVVWDRASGEADIDYRMEWICSPDQVSDEAMAFQLRVDEFDAPLFGGWHVNLPLRLIKR